MPKSPTPGRPARPFPLVALTLLATVPLFAWEARNLRFGLIRSAEASVPTGSSIAMDEEHTIGAPATFDGLTVFPIYAAHQEDLGEWTTLESAVARSAAVVHEVGAEPGGPAPAAGRSSRGSDDAQVNTLVIDNRGELPILVLAGTVVKGGKQDRQIAQDFVVPPGKIVSVDAFCVEHGRWTGTRGGQATEGKFTPAKSLALREVRSAGQYKHNQSEVWSKVAEVNRAANKHVASDTLLATMDDAEIATRRRALASRVEAHLDGLAQRDQLVGMAYSVDGEVRGARWFMHRKIFAQHRTVLIETAAGEAIAPRADGSPAAMAAAPPAASAVSAFVAKASAARAEEKPTAGENVNSFRETDSSYASEATVQRHGKKVQVTSDFVKK